MKTYNYTYIEYKDYFKVLVTKLDDPTFLKEVLIDNTIKNLVKEKGIRILNTGYAVLRKKGHYPLQHLIMNHLSNTTTVVDHINGNRLDNRLTNLRVLNYADNANNRTSNSRSNTGIVGIAKRTNGNYTYFRASVSDRVTLVPNSKAKAQTKRYTKQFNITKLGEAEAMKQAVEWLKVKRTQYGYV